MQNQIVVYPALGRSVPDPVNGDLLPHEGRIVTDSVWWRRRQNDGDVTIYVNKAISEEFAGFEPILGIDPTSPGYPSNQILLIAQVIDCQDDLVPWECYQKPKAIYKLDSLERAVQLGGNGSMLVSMYRTMKENCGDKEIYCLPVSFKSSRENSAAVGFIRLHGVAKEDGALVVYINTKSFQLEIKKGTDADGVAELLTKAVNDREGLPVEAYNGTTPHETRVLMTCKWVGSSGNEISLEINRGGVSAGERPIEGLYFEVVQMDHGCGYPDFEAIFDMLKDCTHEFIAFPWSDGFDPTSLRKLMQDRWSLQSQLFGHLFTAGRGTVGELIDKVNVLKNSHQTYFGFERKAPNTSWDYTAALAGRAALYLSVDPSRTIDGGTLKGLFAPDWVNRFILSERTTLIAFGVPNAHYEGGYLRISSGRKSPHQYQVVSYLLRRLGAITLKPSQRDCEKVKGMIKDNFLKIFREGYLALNVEDPADYFDKSFKVIVEESGTFHLLARSNCFQEGGLDFVYFVQHARRIDTVPSKRQELK